MILHGRRRENGVESRDGRHATTVATAVAGSASPRFSFVRLVGDAPPGPAAVVLVVVVHHERRVLALRDSPSRRGRHQRRRWTCCGLLILGRDPRASIHGLQEEEDGPVHPRINREGEEEERAVWTRETTSLAVLFLLSAFLPSRLFLASCFSRFAARSCLFGCLARDKDGRLANDS